MTTELIFTLIGKSFFLEKMKNLELNAKINSFSRT